MNTEKLGQIQMPAPEDFDPHPRLLLNGRGIHAGETFHALFPDGWREITISARKRSLRWSIKGGFVQDMETVTLRERSPLFRFLSLNGEKRSAVLKSCQI